MQGKYKCKTGVKSVKYTKYPKGSKKIKQSYLDPHGNPIGDDVVINPEEGTSYNKDIMDGINRDSRIDGIYEGNFLATNGVKNREEFYKKYPTEEEYNNRYKRTKPDILAKGTRKVKIKKYTGGTSGVDEDEVVQKQGGAMDTANSIAGAAAPLAAMGGEALSNSAVKNDFGKVDTTKAVGGAALKGASMGASLGSAIPGVGTAIGAAAGTVIGGTIGFINAKKANKEAAKAEAAYNVEQGINKQRASIRPDLTQFQAKQYSKGGYTTKTKVIEIEGKKTPEIHTDKNFNLKNLGSIPHSKGGNKVVAEEGDVVFPTQNSPKKYNEVMSAIMKKDKYKLKKEQSKLPEDKVKKYAEGVQKVWVGNKQVLMSDKEYKDYQSKQNNALANAASKSNQINSLYGDNSITLKLPTSTKTNKGAAPAAGRTTGTKAAPATTSTKVANTPAVKTGKQTTVAPSYSTTGKIANPDAILNTHIGNKGHNVTVGRAGTGDIQTVKAQKQDTKSQYTKEANDAAVQGLKSGKFKVIKGKDSGNKDAAYPWDYYTDSRGVNYQYHGEEIKPEETKPAEPTELPDFKGATSGEPLANLPIPNEEKKKKKGFNLDGNNLMELAPIAYNLGQGLFGKAEKVKRQEYQPELEQYVDTSNNMRREVNQNYKMGRADARNLSAGSAQNFRANAQAAANQKLSQMNSIDSQEYGKQVDVANRNVDRTNEGRKVNIDLFNNYEDLDAQNRAVKQNALSTGLEQLGELGSRNKLQNNQLSNQLASVNLLKNNFGVDINDKGQADGNVNFLKGGGPTYSNNQFGSLNIVGKKKAAKQSKGNKSIQVERKYKLK